jgi:hypothetical protein
LVQIENGPLYSTSDCPEIGPLTSRPMGTITYTFVARYGCGGADYGAHFGGGGSEAESRASPRAQELETRIFPPACRGVPSFGAAERMRGRSECFKDTAGTPSVFPDHTSEHQFWQSAGRQGNFAEPHGLQYRQCRGQHHAGGFLECSVQPLRNDAADGACYGAGRQFFSLR